MKEFNQARVNGGSNYDSLKLVCNTSIYLLSGESCLLKLESERAIHYMARFFGRCGLVSEYNCIDRSSINLVDNGISLGNAMLLCHLGSRSRLSTNSWGVVDNKVFIILSDGGQHTVVARLWSRNEARAAEHTMEASM